MHQNAFGGWAGEAYPLAELRGRGERRRDGRGGKKERVGLPQCLECVEAN